MPIMLIHLRSGALLAALSILAACLQAAQQAESPQRTLFQESPLSEDILHLSVNEQLANSYYKGDILVVELIGGYNTPEPGTIRPPGRTQARQLKDLGIQVWLLRVDGTTLEQRAKVPFGIGSGWWISDQEMFVFEHIAPKELAGVVVRADGKLFVRDIHLSQ